MTTFLKWTAAQHAHDLIDQGLPLDEAVARVAIAGDFPVDEVRGWVAAYLPGSIPDDIFPLDEDTMERVRILDRTVQEGL